MADDEDTVVPVDPEDAEDRTIVVERDDPDDRTIVVERDDPDDRTVVVEHDKTVVIDRGRGKSKGASAPDPDSVLTVLPSRRGIRPAPVEPVREPREPAGAVEAYEPRSVAPAPLTVPAVPRGAEAERTETSALPSVARRSRKSGAVTLLVFAGACAISVIGIVAVVVWFVRS